MKVTVYLRKDHETVRSLFEEYKKLAGKTQNGRKEAFAEIQREISLHSQMETEIFYPALQNTASVRAQELVAKALEEHRGVDSLLDELSAMNGNEKQFDSKMSELMDSINAHIDNEEEEIFDEARKNLPEFRLEELGLEMEDRRRILTQLAA